MLLHTPLLLALLACAPQDPARTTPPKDPEATAKGRDRYLGREVAHTMHWTGAGWLMRAMREQEENGAKLRKWLAVEPGQALCDLGCGNGYHTLPLAKAVGAEGRVFAVDLQPEMLTMLEKRVDEAGLDNVEYLEATVDDPKLPADSCDLVLMVDVYHELSHPVRVMQKVKKALKEKGRVVLVEFRAEDPDVPIKPEHMMSKAQVICEMASHGFAFDAETDDLPWQHAMAFRPARERDEYFAPRQVLRGFLAALRQGDVRVRDAFLSPGAPRPDPALAPARDAAAPAFERPSEDRVVARWPAVEAELRRDAAGRWQVAALRRRS